MDSDEMKPRISIPSISDLAAQMPPQISMPKMPDLTAPKREIELPEEDALAVNEAIAELDNSCSSKDDLFEIFNDWQTKKTLTSKRVFISTSIVVVASSWIGIDYKDLALFGLKVADGDPNKFIIFVLVVILMSGIFYEISRRIDMSVRKAKIANISYDLKSLNEPVEVINDVMDRNNIDSFSDLYFDFKTSFINQQHYALDAYRAVKFYREHLTGAGLGLNIMSVVEQVIIYSVAACAVVALLVSLA